MQALYEAVRKRDPAQSEFLQAVEEVRTHLGKQPGVCSWCCAGVLLKYAQVYIKLCMPGEDAR